MDGVSEVRQALVLAAGKENRLREFKGVYPVDVNIFLRELKGIWEKAKPNPRPWPS